MKHRHILNLLWIALPICIILRLIQLVFTIDSSTGFIRQQYSEISALISFVVFATITALCVLAYFAEGISKTKDELHPLVAVTCVFTGGMYVYETVTSTASLGSWHGILLVFLSLLSAFVFIAFGLKNVYSYNFPSIMLIIPAVYYVVKLIKLFVSTSALALVIENIFLLFTNSALLWFLFEFASFENSFGNLQKSPKKIFVCSIATAMLCAVTAFPKLFLLVSGYLPVSRGDISACLLMLSQALFIFVYTISNFCQKEKKNTKPVSKHSA